MKPFKGYIDQWHKVYMSNASEYPEKNLGYCIIGISADHPDGFKRIRTSIVLFHHNDQIETLNSRYGLLTPFLVRSPEPQDVT